MAYSSSDLFEVYACFVITDQIIDQKMYFTVIYKDSYMLNAAFLDCHDSNTDYMVLQDSDGIK